MRLRRLLPLAALALLIASACASGSASTTADRQESPSGSAIVHLPKSYKFSPKVIEIAAGSEVTWINEDDFPHTVRLLDGSGVDRKLGVGETLSLEFEKPGVYRYDCSLHPTQMSGRVVVGAGGR